MNAKSLAAGCHQNLKSWENASIHESQESKVGYGKSKDKQVGGGHMILYTRDMTIGLYI